MPSLARMFAVFVFVLLAASARAEELPVSIPFDFEGNQIFVKVGVNGSAPRWFILDSGASGCIVDTAFAQRLHLATEGQAQGTGAGRGTVNITFAANVTYSLPGMDLTVPRSYVIDFSNQPALLGREVAGVIGGDFFLRYVVALDFEKSTMTLYAPDRFVPPAGATDIPIVIRQKTPYVVVRTKLATGEPSETIVQIDSGSGDAVDVDALARSPQRLEVIGGVGLGQEFRTVVGRAEWAELGPFRLAAPTGATGGVQLIGLEVLRRFHVVFDYAHARVFLSPNAHFAEPFVFDASGLDLRWTPDAKRFAVHDVAASSPAAEAGIHANDEIVAIDGKPAAGFTIAEVNTMLTKDGQSLELGVRSAGTLRRVILHLRKRL